MKYTLKLSKNLKSIINDPFRSLGDCFMTFNSYGIGAVCVFGGKLSCWRLYSQMIKSGFIGDESTRSCCYVSILKKSIANAILTISTNMTSCWRENQSCGIKIHLVVFQPP